MSAPYQSRLGFMLYHNRAATAKERFVDSLDFPRGALVSESGSNRTRHWSSNKGKGENKMNELVKRVADRVGIGEDQAQKAVETVVGFIKEKMPAVSGQLDSFLGQGGSGGSMADQAKGVGSKLGL